MSTKGIAALLLLAGLAGAAFWLDRRAQRPPELAAALSVSEALGGEADPRFARADAPREFRFPADHGPHAGFRTEWWYVTANLFDPAGRAFGAQLTFFRNALAPPDASEASSSLSTFRSAHVWMAHFAMSDERAGTFRFAERFAREGGGLAGARGEPFSVHLDDWRLAAINTDFAPLRMVASESDFALDLELAPTKPPVLQGENGLSRKGPQPGNASYYYSLPRLAARGTLRSGDSTFRVEGEAWLDREWSTSALGAELAGWDWFALQLDDGSELMYYRLRRGDGSADPFSRGSLVGADGTVRELGAAEVRLSPLSTWTSAAGTTYPSVWRLEVPSAELALELTPRLANQELDVTVRYWEGSVRASGEKAGTRVAGHGFVELTGYERPLSPAQP